MPDGEIDVFAICALEDIGRSDARAFNLARLTPEGESRPFPIVIVRTIDDKLFGYVNVCPHQNTWLNISNGRFFNEARTKLACSRHGAAFDIETGHCNEGPCEGASLEPVAVALIAGDVCLCGVALVEDDGIPDPFNSYDDETMDIMIHPD